MEANTDLLLELFKLLDARLVSAAVLIHGSLDEGVYSWKETEEERGGEKHAVRVVLYPQTELEVEEKPVRKFENE